MSDSLQRFIFEGAPVRGELVHLDATWRAVVEATSQLFRWDIKSREHAAQAIRAALDARQD